MTDTATPLLLTLDETAELLRKSRKQIEWLIYTGKAPKSALIGGRRMFRQADVMAYIAAAFAEADELATASGGTTNADAEGRGRR